MLVVIVPARVTAFEGPADLAEPPVLGDLLKRWDMA